MTIEPDTRADCAVATTTIPTTEDTALSARRVLWKTPHDVGDTEQRRFCPHSLFSATGSGADLALVPRLAQKHPS